MTESLQLFEIICKSKFFPGVPILLVFTKLDLFREKLTRVPLSDHFPEYEGAGDANSAISFFRNKFFALNPPKSRALYLSTVDSLSQEGQNAFLGTFDRLIFRSGISFGVPSDLFAVGVFVNDGYLAFRRPRPEVENLRRFLKILVSLPMELQMVLCHRTASSFGIIISSAVAEISFRSVVTYFH